MTLWKLVSWSSIATQFFFFCSSKFYSPLWTLASSTMSLHSRPSLTIGCMFYSHYIEILMSLVLPSFTWTFIFPSSFYCSCSNLFWHSLISQSFNTTTSFYKFYTTRPTQYVPHLTPSVIMLSRVHIFSLQSSLQTFRARSLLPWSQYRLLTRKSV